MKCPDCEPDRDVIITAVKWMNDLNDAEKYLRKRFGDEAWEYYEGLFEVGSYDKLIERYRNQVKEKP